MPAQKHSIRVRCYAAFLRGVSPVNLKMAELKAALEDAGFTDVRTVLSSGNAVFSAPPASEASLERRVETALQARLGRTFMTIVRPVEQLRALLESDPYEGFKLSARAKRIVTFARSEPKGKLRLPVTYEGARILGMNGRDVFSAYVPSPKGAVFMTLIEKTFGKDVTTRTWETVKKVAK